MTKTGLMKVLEHLPDDCEISVDFYDSGYEALVNQSIASVKIIILDSLNHWSISLHGMNKK